MHHKGGVSEAGKFSLAGSSKASRCRSGGKRKSSRVVNRCSQGGYFFGRYAVTRILGVVVFGLVAFFLDFLGGGSSLPTKTPDTGRR